VPTETLSPLQATLLALVQAVTEFLPISSSGHLILVPRFLGWPDQGLTFDIATHTGTLLAILVYFRHDLRDLLIGFFTGQPRSHDEDFRPRRLAWAIGLGTIPAGVVGLLLEDWIETEARSPLLIAGTLIGFGLLLGLADRLGSQRRGIDEIGWREGLIIGAAQALALIPGTSRSGITITAALLLGFARPAAARFAFLLIVPISFVVALRDVVVLIQERAGAAELIPMAIGLGVSAVAGYAVIAWLLAFLWRRNLTVFVVYRVLLGLVILAVFASG
jgi:undecaprenyl-diphosphatase